MYKHTRKRTKCVHTSRTHWWKSIMRRTADLWQVCKAVSQHGFRCKPSSMQTPMTYNNLFKKRFQHKFSIRVKPLFTLFVVRSSNLEAIQAKCCMSPVENCLHRPTVSMVRLQEKAKFTEKTLQFQLCNRCRLQTNFVKQRMYLYPKQLKQLG